MKQNQNKQICNKLESMTEYIDDLQQYSKSPNILIHGITEVNPGVTEVDLETRIKDFLNTNLQLSVTEGDLNAVHRLARNASLIAGSSTHKPSPILVQFENRQIRVKVMTNRKKLKAKNIMITEHLTAKKSQLLKKASDLVTQNKLTSAWTHDGKILAKATANRTVSISPSNFQQFQ